MTSIAQRKRADRRAEIDRVRALNASTPAGPDGEDHGLDLGPAALARPSSLQRVDGKLRGAGQRNATPVYARMIECVDLFERLNTVSQITDRQAAAGKRMLGLKVAAGLQPRVTARHAVVHEQVHEALEEEVVEEICPPNYDPRTYYRLLLRKLGSEKARLVDAACDWNPEHPIGRPPTAWMATFKAALDLLADEFGLKRIGVGPGTVA